MDPGVLGSKGRRWRVWGWAGWGATLLAACFLPASAPAVLPGLDVIRDLKPPEFRGKKLGLLTNHTGKTLDGVPAAAVLADEVGGEVVALFSPEHGFDGRAAAGEPVDTRALGDIPLYSLYGSAHKPTPEMLKGIDTLVFDMQDVGVRFYTYISTLKLAMEAAADAGIEFVVLDRPNPNSGDRVEGPVLERRLGSFVGIAPLALLHGMTVGELAHFFIGEKLLDTGSPSRLRVVSMRGWQRSMWWEETGLVWTPPSPNIPRPETAIVYAATGLLEGVDISEGRGTEDPFFLAGAPWIDGNDLVAQLESRQLPGVSWRPASFVPRPLEAAPRPRYAGKRCWGLRLELTAREEFQAVLTGLSILAVLREMHRPHFRWVERNGDFTLDRLLGSEIPRQRLEAGEEVAAIVARFGPELDRFREQRQRYLIYD